MLGRITKFREDIGLGVIECEGGRRFRFSMHEIASARQPTVGEEVDFLLVQRRPQEIVLLSACPWTALGAL
jgi:hypothetical protein